MDKLRAMQVFSLVAELGSFTKAADALNLPNATVSTLVAQLEAHLQVKLLARTTRRLSLTEDGSAYVERVRRVLTELVEIEDALAGQTRAPQGRVRVDVPAAAGRHVLAPALPDFFARYPNITLEIGSTDRPVDLVAEGVDCVIRGGATHDESLVAKPLGTFETITCAAPSYLARAGEPQLLTDFASHTVVNFFSAKTGRVFPFEFTADGQTHVLHGRHQVAANDADTHVAMGVAGLGLIQVPRTRAVMALLASGQLRQVLGQYHAGTLPLVLLYPRNRHLSARVRAFVDWTVALYAEKFKLLTSH
ncbi:MAG: LysR substrate-binding domain-containing protein [Burkholderiaceae bacterium]